MRILITAGPTREYIDDVRYLSNASSGRMGYALAQAALDQGHQVVLVSGPVDLNPPAGCEFHSVETTDEMRDASVAHFPSCNGVIAAAAVSDYKPRERVEGKLAKTGGPISIDMIETDDVLAQLGAVKGSRWVVGFALESQNARENALQKLRAKNCNWIVLNHPTAIGSLDNQIELIDDTGHPIMKWAGAKQDISSQLIQWLETNIPDTNVDFT